MTSDLNCLAETVLIRCHKILVCPNVLKFREIKTINFPFGTNGKLIVLGVQVLNILRCFP